MSEFLNPEKIYKKFLKNKISKTETIKSLESLINESDDEKIRANAIEFLQYFYPLNSRISKIVEKSLISDESPLVRAQSGITIIKSNLKDAKVALEWQIKNEKSIIFFKMILDYLDSNSNLKEYKLKDRIFERLSQIYKLNKMDAIFVLDLDYLDYKKFINSFNDFVLKFNIKEEKRKELIKNNSNIGYKGLGRITSVKNGFITSLFLNDLKKIPKSIQNLSKLEYLEINRSNIENLLDSRGFLSNIKKLTLKNNIIDYIPKWVLKVASRDNYIEKYLKSNVEPNEAPILGLLEILTGQAFVKLEKEKLFHPSLLFHYKLNETGNITAIHLSSELSRIGIIPKEICKLNFLEELFIVNQNIKTIPECIVELHHLKILDLSYNKIIEIPNSIGKLESLEHLYFKCHEGDQTLRSIPKSLINLSKLKVLNLSGYALEDLPKSIQSLKQLII